MKASNHSHGLHYVIDGEGPPVIMIHGITASSADWWRLMPLLVSAGYQAIAVDMLGHGDSDKPRDGRQYTSQKVYAALEAWIDSLGIETPFYLIGHSLGGYMSLTYAMNHPDRIRAMVLISPFYCLEQITRVLDTLLPLAGVGAGLLRATPQWLVNSFLSYNDSFLTHVDQETRWAYSRDIKRASPHVLRIPKNMPDLTKKLPSIEPATMVLWGEEDRIEKTDSFPRLVSGLANATGKGILKAGHHPHQGQPELVSRMVLDFFASHPIHADEGAAAREALEIDAGQVAGRIEAFIREQVDAMWREGVVLGLSGGLDSAVVASLAARALGPENVLALLMPERESSPDSRRDAMREVKRLGIKHKEVDISSLLSAMGVYGSLPLGFLGLRSLKAAVVQQQHRVQAEALGEMPLRAGLLGTRGLGEKKQVIDRGIAYVRAKARLRTVTLYYYAELENRLVLGTTNWSESQVGTVVKWGDNVGDAAPLLPLYKTQVRQLARYLDVSQEVMDKAPNPDLMPGIVDGLALGIDFQTLDTILWGLERGWDKERVVRATGVAPDQVENVEEMRRRSEHMRVWPPEPELG
ncbi:NAD(+) synthase [Chloroflexota bacterium]